MQNRRMVILIAIAALLGAGCGGASTASPTRTLTSTPTSTPGPMATQAATVTPTAAPSATSSAGQMAHAHSTHTATALVDGRVLIAGGWDGVGVAAWADLYDPGTATFAATGPMATARGLFTATRLSDGRVLVAGGTPADWNQPGPELASAELYDAKTGTFSPTGSLKAARSFHVATLLADGRVLITGGSPVGMDAVHGHNLATAEVYDPKTGEFSPTGSMTTERASHTGTRLADGRVLITGGALATATDAGSLSQASAELYDLKTGTFKPTGSMSFARTFQEATLLADGRILVTGGSADGWSYDGHYYAEAEIYDPKAGTFTATGPIADTLVSHTATLLPGGRVLIAGGYDGRADLTTAELYDPNTGMFSLTSPGG